MFSHIFSFEVSYWLRRPMVYIFIFVNFLMLFGATASDNVVIGSVVGTVFKNAPSMIQGWFGIMSLFSILMTAAFMQGAALRDFDNNTYQIVFASPISRKSYFFGRFFGAAFVSVLPALGLSLGVILGAIVAPIMGWTDAERYTDIYWSAHFNSFVVIVVPMVLLAGGIIFTVAALSRSTMAAFISAVILLIGYAISGIFMEDISNENMVVFTDIFGQYVLGLVTKYWSVEQQNTLSVSLLDAKMGLNRLFFSILAMLIVAFGYFKFSFTEKTSGKKAKANIAETPAPALGASHETQVFEPNHSPSSAFTKLWSVAKNNYFAIAKDTTFIVLLFAGLVLMTITLVMSKSSYGLTSFPVTYIVIGQLINSMNIFMLAIITFYSGQMMWRERDTKFEQIHDALPYSTWISYVGKFAAMIGVFYTVQATMMVVGIASQAASGFYDFNLPLYFNKFFIEEGYKALTMVALSMFVHSLVNNKYIGFFTFVLLRIGAGIVASALDIESKMIRLFEYPSNPYSDMVGFGPSETGKHWFMAYWLLFCGILAILTIAFWSRSRDDAWRNRWASAKIALTGKMRIFALSTTLLFGLVGSFVFYNTKVLNTFIPPKPNEKLQVAYEQKYKKFENTPFPAIVDVVYNMDIFPKERNLEVKAVLKLVNKSPKPMDSLHFTVSQTDFKFKLDVPNSKLVLNDTILEYKIYQLATALQPNDTLVMSYTAKHLTKGFENKTTFMELSENGTFFNNSDITPSLGYQARSEISDKNDRKKYGLPARPNSMPALPPHDSIASAAACMKPIIGGNAAWVNMTTTISTSADQTAIAPGSLIKEWKQGDRNYYTYKLDKPSVFFGAFCSARYQIKREEWNGVKLEVYYDAKHPYNIDRILNSMRKSLDYYTTNFGPYYHKQCRVIEFPRYQNFAQSFPGTMPYSEAIGFIDNYKDAEAIDKVFYVVAHEIGHQYWGHQVTEANVQGGSMLSETFAQYSALMVMEKEYGHDAMRKFLSYELDNFLNSRGAESAKESPLGKVEYQSYIYYQKGSLAMYYLKEMIGADKINDALHELVVKYGYKEPPYPTSYAAIDAFEARTPDSLKYIINDLFWKIIVFDNRTLDATAKKLADGTYETTIKVSAEKILSDSLGKEKNLPINDIIDVGVFAQAVQGKKYGKQIATKRIHINKKENTYTFITKEKPYEAGIDPNCYLIDKVASDNVKKVNGL